MTLDDIERLLRMIFGKLIECNECASISSMYVMTPKRKDLWSAVTFHRLCPKHAFEYIHPHKKIALPYSIGKPRLSLAEWQSKIKLPKHI
jgi:hypothetical protein